MGNFKTYFNSMAEIASGIAESIMMFVSSWLVSYNLVYTLWALIVIFQYH